MAQSLDLYIDVTRGELLPGGSAINGGLPTLTRNDSYNLRVRLRERDSGGFLRDLNTSGISVKLGIGGIEDSPTDGQFKLTLGAVTSTAISFNATTTQIYNAISGIAGAGVSVATFGSITQGVYLITSATANTALSFGSDSFTLFPTSSVLINTRRNPATGVPAQQVIKLVRNPAAYADTFTASPTAGVVALTLLQEGSSTKNEIYKLSIGPDAEGGSVVLNFGTNSTTAIPIAASAASFVEALNAIADIGEGNISVDAGGGNFSISFVRDLGLQNVATALTLDDSGVIFGTFLQSTVTLNTSGIDELFFESGTDTITPTLEVEINQSGTPKTILQSQVTVRKDLITTGSAVPAPQASYLTSAESYAAFVSSQNNVGFYGTTAITKPANTTVVSALVNLGLIANTVTVGVVGGSVTFPTVALTGSAITVTDNIPFVFGTANGSKFGTATGQKISFYNSTPIVQPANTNVVSALVNLGLIADTVAVTFPTVALTGSAITVTDNIPFVFGTTTGNRLGTTTSQKLSFFGSSPIVQPANTNVVSALVNLGLIADTVAVTFPTVALTGSAITVTDNIPFVFGTTSGSKIGTSTAQKIAFFNSTPIVQPISTNVVSALVNLGLIATSVTLGLPTNVVTDWTGNVSATTRFLADSSAVTSVDWGNRVLKTATGATAVNWETQTIGAGSTVVTIGANNVAISGSYYIAMGTGNGAFRTLSTTTSVTFGTVAGNDQHYRDVVVTGAAVNDIVLVGLPSAISAGAIIQGVVYKTNTVCLSCVNADSVSRDVNTATYRVTVLNYQ
jgi:hypothetical protein